MLLKLYFFMLLPPEFCLPSLRAVTVPKPFILGSSDTV
nr:MAG TPA: hypothetical protein [Caudoviricetes sp.]